MKSKNLVFSLLAASTLFANPVTTPESFLPAGVDENTFVNPFTGYSAKARKGTIATTIAHVARLNELLAISAPTAAQKEEIRGIIESQKSLSQSLKALGVFDIFNLNEWMHTDQMPGRVLTALVYLEDNRDLITPEITSQLKEIAAHPAHPLIGEKASAILS